MDIINDAKRVFDIEIDALKKTRDALDGTFEKIIDRITHCEGKVIITGMGKPGHIATKLAATFSSLGTPSFYLHPGEAMHGDLGMVSSKDIVIAISYSGESDEIVRILPNIKFIGAELIAITGNADSTLAMAADILQVLPKMEEACHLGLAPTSSTTAVLCYGDALAVVASGIYGFSDVDFGRRHPAGSLGKKLILRVKDLMKTDGDNACIIGSAILKDAIVVLSEKRLGVISVVDENNMLKGIITDGDLRRRFCSGIDIYSMKAEGIMNTSPTVVDSDALAVDALDIMRKRKISCLPVVKQGRLEGTIIIHDIVERGIV